MKRNILIFLCVLAAVLVTATIAWYGYTWYEHKMMQEPTVKPTDPYATHGEKVLETNVPPADPMIVGKWVNAKNPQWHKVYYDDYDGEGYYWGKEWDEKEDVQEVDLVFHGNGWFRWKKEGRQLSELHTMDARDVPIGKNYTISQSTTDSLAFYEPAFRQTIYLFTRVSE